jgi:hypothetical protein
MSISDDLKAYLEAHRRLLLSEVAQIDKMLGREPRHEHKRVDLSEPRFIFTDQAPLDQEVLRRG